MNCGKYALLLVIEFLNGIDNMLQRFYNRYVGCGVFINSMKLFNNNHSVFALHYHLILVVKYRRGVINDPISARLSEIFEYTGNEYKITTEEWNHDIDYVHVLFRAEPKSELSHFINAYKSACSRLIRKEHPEIRKKLWKEMFRTCSFCLIATGGAPLETIRSYIEHQVEK